jgi:septum formation protein
MRLILASGSAARRSMFENAGLAFEIMPAGIDEESVMKTAQAQGMAFDKIAQKLADEKAILISHKNPEALVIGADQVMECEGALLQKAQDKNQAREKLKRLRGKTHSLVSAVSVAQNGEILWRHASIATLSMQNFSDETLERYIDRAGDVLTSCVGAYALEGIGVRLFEKIEGEYFTILGLPLLPLLNYLRQEQGLNL